MNTCYYCGAKSVTTAHDVPVCKDHKPEDPPTDRMQAASPYDLYPPIPDEYLITNFD